MLQNTNEIDAAIPFKSLPKIRVKNLHPDLQKVIGKDHNLRLVCQKMVGYIMISHGLQANEVDASYLTTDSVEYTVMSWSSNLRWNIVIPARNLCRLLGDKRHFPWCKTEYYHPLLSSWLETLPSSIRITARSTCMFFLGWVTTNRLYRCEKHLVPIQLISRDVLLSYRRFIVRRVNKGEIAVVTASCYLTYLTRWLRWLESNGKICLRDLSRLTIRHIRNESKRTLPSHEHIDSFLAALISNNNLQDYVPYFLLLVNLGARPIEIRLLTFNMVDTQHHRIFLQSKRGFGRWMTPSGDVWNCFNAYVQNTHQQYPEEGFVFANKNGQPYSRTHMRNAFKAICKEAGVNIDGQMAFRHRFATDCLEKELDLNITRYMMGHQDTSQLRRYQHVNQVNVSKKVNSAISSASWAGDCFVW